MKFGFGIYWTIMLFKYSILIIKTKYLHFEYGTFLHNAIKYWLKTTYSVLRLVTICRDYVNCSCMYKRGLTLRPFTLHRFRIITDNSVTLITFAELSWHLICKTNRRCDVQFSNIHGVCSLKINIFSQFYITNLLDELSQYLLSSVRM